MLLQQALQIAQLIFFILSSVSLVTIIIKNLYDTYKVYLDIKEIEKEKAKSQNVPRKRK